MALLTHTQAAPQQLFTAADAARLTGWSYWFVRDLARTGEAPVAAVFGRGAPLFDDKGIAWLKERRLARCGGNGRPAAA